MKTIRIIATSPLLAISIGSKAQVTNKAPQGKAIVQIFTNFHSGFGSTKKYRGFALDRSYLGYEYSFGKGVSVKDVIDIGLSNDIDDYL